MKKNKIDDSHPRMYCHPVSEVPMFTIAFSESQVDKVIADELIIANIEYIEEFRHNNELLFNVYLICHCDNCCDDIYFGEGQYAAFTEKDYYV